jgi:hypothetical protein
MNIATPVSNHDKHLLPTFVKVLQHFGGLEEATICFFTTPSAKAEAHEAAAALNATVHTFEVDFAGGWPVASGAQFAATVFTIPNIGWNGPWLWMELDMLPVKRGWVQAIRNGYTLCGSPFMGNVVPTAWVEEGKLVVKEDDLMMMGCGVYPANMDRDQRFRPLLSDLVKPADRNPHTPFDFYLRHAMRQAGFANTTLIADMWQTHEYKRTGKGITCKPVPLDKPRRERGGLVPPEAVLVHGCKDGTLAELLLRSHEIMDVLKPVISAPKPAFIDPAFQTTITPPTSQDAPIVLTEAESTTAPLTGGLMVGIEKAAEAYKPPLILPAPVATHSGGFTKEPESPEPDKPKITRTAFEAMRKSKKGVAIEMAQGLGISLGDFAPLLREFGYVIAKGGKLKSTEP